VIHQHIVAFSLAMACSFLLVVVCAFDARFTHLFELRPEEQMWQMDITGAGKRASGPLGNPQGVGTAVCVAVPLAIGLLVHRPRRRFIVPVALLLLVTSLSALLVAKSRSGLFGLTGMFALMTMLSKQRVYAIAFEVLIIFGVSVFLVGGELESFFQERLEVEQLQYDLAIRMDIWMETITEPSPWIILCGEGEAEHSLRFGRPVHSGYLTILFVWGLGGTIVFTILIWLALKWTKFTQRFDPDSCCRGVAWGFRWGMVAVAGLAISTGPWNREFYLMMVYFLLCIVCTRFMALRRQQAMLSDTRIAYLQSPAAPCQAGV